MTNDVKQKFVIFNTQRDLVYLDSAATALKPKEVIAAEIDYYENFSSNVHRGLYPIADKATNAYEEARTNISKFINAELNEIVFCSGTTDGINFIAKSLKESGLISMKPRILLSELEHHSNIVPWQMIGAEKVEYIKLNNDLELNIDDLSTTYDLQSKTDIVAVSLVSNVTGHIADIKKIRQLFPNSYLVVDAAQAIPHIPIDVKELDIDFLVFSGHKLYGPTGIGVIYGKKEIFEKLIPFRTGGGMIREVYRDRTNFSDLPEKFEAGTPNIAGALGLSAAINFVKNLGFDAIMTHENELRRYALEKLNRISEINIFHAGSIKSSITDSILFSDTEVIKSSSPENTKGSIGVISFAHEKIHAHDISQFLGDRGVCVRAGHHCTQILHRDILKVPATTRLSIGIYNTKEDIDRFIEALKECLNFYK